MTAMFVNLPATDLERSKAFYTAIGFAINPAMSDHNGNILEFGWMDPVAATQGRREPAGLSRMRPGK
ncbi:MAG: glyoxalase [Rhodoglobus sp.]|nr:glyoxalase [Rhodoglobus sp.]